MTARARHFSAAVIFVSLLMLLAPPGQSESLVVTVVDGRDRSPIVGAFVMVGPAKTNPFTGNTGLTAAGGTITFQSPALVGPQTVTAGAAGYAYFTVIESAQTSVTIPLAAAVADTTIYGPTARVTGNVTGISTPIDSNLDAALVMPAMTLDEIIGAGSIQFDAPTEIMTLPLIGDVYVPGNLSIPTQIELLMTISKPIYHLDLRAQTTQTVYAVAARMPISALLSAPPGMDLLKYATVRGIGVERDRPIGSGLSQNISVDITLSTQLTVTFEGAPLGTQVMAASLGSIPGWDGFERIIGYDTDFALVDSTGTFELASWNPTPTGDMSDVDNLVAGFYADTSAYNAFTSGRVDRTPFVIPTTRVLRDFYDPPQLTQQGARFAWDDVATPGVEPDPTWVLNSITTGPVISPDPSVDTTLVWRIAVPASKGSFSLPSLPAEAPGPPSGLPDVDATPAADRLIWDAYVANPSGALSELLERPSTGVTHFSRRAQTLNLRPADVAIRPAAEGRALRTVPNPASGAVRLLFDRAFTLPARVEILDLQGRRVRSLVLPAGALEVTWDGRDERDRATAPGIYFARLEGGAAGTVKLQRLR